MPLRKITVIEKVRKLVLKGDFKQAIKEWKKLAASMPNDGNSFNAIGDLYLKSGDKARATTAFIQSADVFQSAGFQKKSIALYKKALKVDPSRKEVYEKLADIYSERGLTSNAIAGFLKAAIHYFEQGDLPASLSLYKKVAEMNADDIEVHLKISEICLKQAHEDEAMASYRKAATLYEDKNMIAEAENIRKKIAALGPAHPEKEGFVAQEQVA